MAFVFNSQHLIVYPHSVVFNGSFTADAAIDPATDELNLAIGSLKFCIPAATFVQEDHGNIWFHQFFADFPGASYLTNIDEASVAATGSISFTDIPTATKTVTIGTHVSTFVANGGPVLADQIELGTDLTTTIDNLLTYLVTTQAADTDNIAKCDYAVIGEAGAHTGITVTAKVGGPDMNGFAIASNDAKKVIVPMADGITHWFWTLSFVASEMDMTAMLMHPGTAITLSLGSQSASCASTI